MDLPFYTTFKGFKDNYDKDLEEWLQKYPDGDKDDFLREVRDLYLSFLYRRGDRYVLREVQSIGKEVGLSVKRTKNPYIENYKIYEEEEPLYLLEVDAFKRLKYSLPKIVEYVNNIINLRKSRNVHFVGYVDPETGEVIPVEGDPPYTCPPQVQQASKESNPITPEPTINNRQPEKITINGSLQLIGHIFTELIEKGYIEPKRKNGKANASATAEMLLNHFNFTYNTNGTQPTKEYLKKTLFEQNKLSADKTDLIKIPHLKKLID
ncbi:hypothetical protein [Riemerella columbipharyngis]|uniref:Uncharacterized protein n=1 Tax=Riemerella columbipharyngis TaxID=1071918 RepID=A0A1G7DA90_9FLAO|nr:hypothetical protein [Riemerella columbipharyngis]SDE48477.1 hypothetical protein SAMN05421544_11066 [Riemerella columbipharyngis]